MTDFTGAGALQSQIWQEALCMRLHVGLQDIAAAISLYNLRARLNKLDMTDTDAGKARRDFEQWLRAILSLRQPSLPYETDRQNRFSERRGTDPAANRAEDYTDTF